MLIRDKYSSSGVRGCPHHPSTCLVIKDRELCICDYSNNIHTKFTLWVLGREQPIKLERKVVTYRNFSENTRII